MSSHDFCSQRNEGSLQLMSSHTLTFQALIGAGSSQIQERENEQQPLSIRLQQVGFFAQICSFLFSNATSQKFNALLPFHLTAKWFCFCGSWWHASLNANGLFAADQTQLSTPVLSCRNQDHAWVPSAGLPLPRRQRELWRRGNQKTVARHWSHAAVCPAAEPQKDFWVAHLRLQTIFLPVVPPIQLRRIEHCVDQVGRRQCEGLPGKQCLSTGKGKQSERAGLGWCQVHVQKGKDQHFLLEHGQIQQRATPKPHLGISKRKADWRGVQSHHHRHHEAPAPSWLLVVAGHALLHTTSRVWAKVGKDGYRRRPRSRRVWKFREESHSGQLPFKDLRGTFALHTLCRCGVGGNQGQWVFLGFQTNKQNTEQFAICSKLAAIEILRVLGSLLAT